MKFVPSSPLVERAPIARHFLPLATSVLKFLHLQVFCLSLFKAKGPKRPLTMQYTYKIIQTIHTKYNQYSKAVITNGATLNNQTGKCFVD